MISEKLVFQIFDLKWIAEVYSSVFAWSSSLRDISRLDDKRECYYHLIGIYSGRTFANLMSMPIIHLLQTL